MRGPRGYPVVGVAPFVRRDPLEFFGGLSQKYGDIVDLNLAGKRLIMVNDPELIGDVLQHSFHNYRKSKFYDRLKPMLGSGFLTSEGDEWLQQRHAAAPAFKGAALASMCAVMAEETEATLTTWSHGALDREVRDVSIDMMQLTLRIVTRALFSSRFSNDRAGEISKALTVVLREAERRIWSIATPPLWLPTTRNRRFQDAVRIMDDVFEHLYSKRKSSGRQNDDLLDFLIDAYDHDHKMLRDLVISILMAGHESTATALTWAFYLLSQNRSWAVRVREEARQVLGDGTPDFQALHNLPVTKAVLEEAMRLFPPFWTFSRDAREATTLGDTKIAAGQTVMICAYAMHRDPRYWSSPHEFRPERFIGEDRRTQPAYVYIPFGGGPRSCLGSRFAMFEGLIILAKALSRFQLDFAGDDPPEPEPMITLRPRGGMKMRLSQM